MVTPYMLDEHCCEVFGVHCVSAWDEVPELRESVDNYPDCVLSIRFWESCDEIHCNVFPWFPRNWEWSEDSVGSMSRGFCSSTHVAVLHEFLDVFPHAWPVV